MRASTTTFRYFSPNCPHRTLLFPPLDEVDRQPPRLHLLCPATDLADPGDLDSRSPTQPLARTIRTSEQWHLSIAAGRQAGRQQAVKPTSQHAHKSPPHASDTRTSKTRRRQDKQNSKIRKRHLISRQKHVRACGPPTHRQQQPQQQQPHRRLRRCDTCFNTSGFWLLASGFRLLASGFWRPIGFKHEASTSAHGGQSAFVWMRKRNEDQQPRPPPPPPQQQQQKRGCD
ncbi:uncharacterized protein J3D65DRAFT_171089 [Phyllosticta citribraziliensis]|uniref:Uncharacterized protein n=1 Tax=Phyllosticta citribraziliensis TaxID=989973 RepID=A0ABR1L7C7_9PEZI